MTIAGQAERPTRRPYRSAQRDRAAQADAGEQNNRAIGTRQRILDAARAAFAEHGYLETTVDHVIARCQVSRGTFYYYFKNKDEAFEQLVLLAVGEMYKHRTPNIASRDRYLRIEAVNRNYLRAWAEHRDILRNLNQAANIEPRFAALSNQLRMGYVATVRASLARQVAAGECRALDPDIVAEALGSMVAGFAQRWLGLGVIDIPEANFEAVVRQLSETWYHALYGGKLHEGGLDGAPVAAGRAGTRPTLAERVP